MSSRRYPKPNAAPVVTGKAIVVRQEAKEQRPSLFGNIRWIPLVLLAHFVGLAAAIYFLIS